ncbi:MAG: AMP-binding protein, partial [Pseudomonadota bacterium]
LRAADAAPEVWTAADLRAAVGGSIAGLIASGVGRGDRVLLRLGHSVDVPILFVAAAGLGAVPVPLAPDLTLGEVAAVRSATAPALVIDGLGGVPDACPLAEAQRWRALPAAPAADTGADDPAYMVFTSGTGGAAKGVLHAHRAVWARRMMWDDWYGLQPGDRMLHAGAFNWTFTLGTGLMDPWAAGATALIYTGPPDRGVWAEIARRHGPTLFAGAPGVFRQLLGTGAVTPEAFAALRHALTAGEALPPMLAETWRRASGREIYEALGMSEVSTYISDRPDGRRALPQHGRRIAILEEAADTPAPRGTPGRLAVATSDPGLMLGYWREGAAVPHSDPWFVTGDRALMGADGRIEFLGRTDTLLNAQGFRVAPEEVEAVIGRHPGVVEALVVALPVRAEVTILAAFVVADDNVTNEALDAHCRAHLARYKCPRAYHRLAALPRTARGKRDRAALVRAHGWRPT